MKRNDYIDECLRKIEEKIPLSLEEFNFMENLLRDLWDDIYRLVTED
jgi:hypothetical protein